MGTQDRLARIYDEHSDSLYAFLIQQLHDQELAKEALQEVFRKIAERPEILTTVRTERPFLIRMAHHQSIDLVRKHQTSREYHTRYGAERLHLFANTPDPDEAAFREALASALRDLPPEQRLVAHLKLWEQFTFEEIAHSLNISPNTAASRYRYAINKLRTLLRPIYNEIK